MRKSVMVAVVGLSLGGCGPATTYQITHMTPDELTKVSDAGFCRSGTENDLGVVTERQKRELGDCSSDHLYCRHLGVKQGTDAYVQCRLQARQIAAQEDMADAQRAQAFTAAQKSYQPAVTTTNCNTFGNTMNCTTH